MDRDAIDGPMGRGPSSEALDEESEPVSLFWIRLTTDFIQSFPWIDECGHQALCHRLGRGERRRFDRLAPVLRQHFGNLLHG